VFPDLRHGKDMCEWSLQKKSICVKKTICIIDVNSHSGHSKRNLDLTNLDSTNLTNCSGIPCGLGRRGGEESSKVKLNRYTKLNHYPAVIVGLAGVEERNPRIE
jgi:hypothetical protein